VSTEDLQEPSFERMYSLDYMKDVDKVLNPIIKKLQEERDRKNRGFGPRFKSGGSKSRKSIIKKGERNEK
jgi:hypothetical protein